MPHHSEAIVPLDDEDYIFGKGRIARSSSGSCRSGWEEFGDKCYKALGGQYSEARAYTAAKAYCAHLKSTLASVHSIEEHNFLRRKISHHSHGTWIGLHRMNHRDDFRWLDGSALDFTKWDTGKPNNHRSARACVYMESSHGSRWSDGTCKNKRPFICQSIKDSGGNALEQPSGDGEVSDPGDRVLDQSSGDGEEPQCTDEVCGNGGTCVDEKETGDFRCVCTTGYSGEKCEEEISVPGSNISDYIYIIAGVTAVVSLIIIVVVIVLVKRSRKRAKNSSGSVARAADDKSVSMSSCIRTQNQY